MLTELVREDLGAALRSLRPTEVHAFTSVALPHEPMNLRECTICGRSRRNWRHSGPASTGTRSVAAVHADGRSRPHVGLAASSPALTDDLRTLLADDADVTIVLADTNEVFDVAVVSSGGPQVRAELVIELEGDPGARGGGWMRSEVGADRRLVDLDAVLAVVRSAGRRG